jgi:hexulose-6-phosphate isomerase
MTAISRRQLLAAALAAPLRPPLQIGVMAGNLRQPTELAGIAEARRLGFDGVQVSLGRITEQDGLPLALAARRQPLTAALDAARMPLWSTYLDILHVNCLKNDKLARRWVVDGLEATRRLGAGTMMIVFFFKCSLTARADQDYTAGVLKELIPHASRAGVVLGFENDIPVADNVRMHDEIASDWFKIWYDVGNARNLIGEDPAASIRLLGRQRLCQLHFKDKTRLGEGPVDFPAVIRALRDIGYHGYATVEGSCPGPDVAADMARNLTYLRGIV